MATSSAEVIGELRNKLHSYSLKDGVAKPHRSKLESLVNELRVASGQLLAVGGDRNKLTAQYTHPWSINQATLATLDYELVKLASEHGDTRNMSFHDPLTLLKRKTFYGALLETVQKKDLRIVFASGDLDNFKTINDCWSHAHGDFAIIAAATVIAAAERDLVATTPRML